MSLVFVECPNTFRIDDDNINRLPINSFPNYGFPPTPQSLCAGIDCRPNPESIATIEQQSIE
jgi:hypothetical protein